MTHLRRCLEGMMAALAMTMPLCGCVLGSPGTPTCARRTGRRSVQYQNDYILRIIEQMGAAIREAFKRHSEGGAVEESLELTDSAIELVVDMDPRLFLKLAPQSMVSFLEISALDDRLTVRLAETLELQAEILLSEGSLIEASVRREQAAAVRASIDPSHAN